MANYLLTHFKGVYRIMTEYDVRNNQFPRRANGSLEDIDCYIKCKNDIRIFYYGDGLVQVYVPTVKRGIKIAKAVTARLGKDNVSDYTVTDAEALFLIPAKMITDVEDILQPTRRGASISPFSPKNLPKSDYEITGEDLKRYEHVTAKIPKENLLVLSRLINNFIKDYCSPGGDYNVAKDEMALMGIKGKNYIHHSGKWNEFIKYIEENI